MKKATLWITIFTILDQLTKQTARFFLYDSVTESVETKTVIPYLLRFSYHENTGASFSSLQGETNLFLVVTIIALAIFIYLLKDVDFKVKKVYSISLIFFIAGTLGNFIDRMLFGYVIDFMQFPFLEYPLVLVGLNNFYNNFADMYLSAAIVLFAIDIFFLEKKRRPGVEVKDENNQD